MGSLHREFADHVRLTDCRELKRRWSEVMCPGWSREAGHGRRHALQSSLTLAPGPVYVNTQQAGELVVVRPAGF